MNRLARCVMLLYPARWRRRYGNEVEALIDDAGADARVVADLLKTAVRMQFSTWSFPRLAAVLGLVGMLAGLAFSFLTPVKNVARAELQLTGADSSRCQTMQMASSMVTSRAVVTVVYHHNPAILICTGMSAGQQFRSRTSSNKCAAILFSARTVRTLLLFSSLTPMKPKRKRLCAGNGRRMPARTIEALEFDCIPELHVDPNAD